MMQACWLGANAKAVIAEEDCLADLSENCGDGAKMWV
jgi:hypothetical protein